MSTCPIHALPIPQVAHEIWTAASAEEKAALSSEAALEKLIRLTQKNGGLNLPPKERNNQAAWDSISQAEATRFLDGFYSRSFAAFTQAKIFAAHLPQIFFDGKIHGSTARQTQSPAKVDHCSDGDTCTVLIGEENCDKEKVSIRFSGIDTPESFISVKFRGQLFAALRALQAQGTIKQSDLPSDVEINAELARHAAPAEKLEHFVSLFPQYPLVTLMARRMVFDGKVASTVMHGLTETAQARGLSFSTEDSYVRRLSPGDDSQRCDLMNTYDMYLRRISILHVSDPNFVSSFITTTLPQLGTHDPALQGLANAELSTAEKTYLQSAQPEMKKLLNPKDYPTWQQLFSPANITNMNAAWNILPPGDRKTDLNMAMVAMGVAFSYTKYRMQFSDDYNKVEQSARQAAWGLWKSPFFILLDPQGQQHLVENGKFIPFTPPPDCLTGQ